MTLDHARYCMLRAWHITSTFCRVAPGFFIPGLPPAWRRVSMSTSVTLSQVSQNATTSTDWCTSSHTTIPSPRSRGRSKSKRIGGRSASLSSKARTPTGRTSQAGFERPGGCHGKRITSSRGAQRRGIALQPGVFELPRPIAIPRLEYRHPEARSDEGSLSNQGC